MGEMREIYAIFFFPTTSTKLRAASLDTSAGTSPSGSWQRQTYWKWRSLKYL